MATTAATGSTHSIVSALYLPPHTSDVVQPSEFDDAVWVQKQYDQSSAFWHEGDASSPSLPQSAYLYRGKPSSASRVESRDDDLLVSRTDIHESSSEHAGSDGPITEYGSPQNWDSSSDGTDAESVEHHAGALSDEPRLSNAYESLLADQSAQYHYGEEQEPALLPSTALEEEEGEGEGDPLGLPGGALHGEDALHTLASAAAFAANDVQATSETTQAGFDLATGPNLDLTVPSFGSAFEAAQAPFLLDDPTLALTALDPSFGDMNLPSTAFDPTQQNQYDAFEQAYPTMDEQSVDVHAPLSFYYQTDLPSGIKRSFTDYEAGGGYTGLSVGDRQSKVRSWSCYAQSGVQAVIEGGRTTLQPLDPTDTLFLASVTEEPLSEYM